MLWPQWGIVGKKERAQEDEGQEAVRYILFTHLHFDVHYNGDNGACFGTGD